MTRYKSKLRTIMKNVVFCKGMCSCKQSKGKAEGIIKIGGSWRNNIYKPKYRISFQKVIFGADVTLVVKIDLIPALHT